MARGVIPADRGLVVAGVVMSVLFPPGGAAVGVMLGGRQPLRSLGMICTSAWFTGLYVYLLARR